MKYQSHVINNKRIVAFRNRQHFLDYIKDKKRILIALNAEKLIKSDSELDALINDNIGYPDGIGAVWALRRNGLKATKIPGAEFWLDIISANYASKSFYLIGATQEVVEKTVQRLQNEFTGIDIKGFRNGFLKEADEESVLKELIGLQPDFVFVAMGSPRQEFVMARFLKEYKTLYMGLGGSFDIYSGTKKRAPKFFLKFGLEWLYRLLKEPTRISRQIKLVEFFFKIIFGKI